MKTKFYNGIFKSEEYYIEQGKIYLEQKKYTKAIKEFKKAIRVNPENGEAHFELGKIYYIQKRIPPAIEELKIVIGIDDKNKHAHLLLGKTYILQEKFSLALREYKKAQELGYDDWEMYRELGDIYQKKKVYDLSIENFKKAIELNPENKEVCGEIHEILSRIYFNKGEYELAMEELKKVLDIAPVNGEVYKNFCCIYNTMLNEIEISQKKTILKSKPRNLGVTLTNRCNLRCKMCFAWRISSWDIPEIVIKEIMELFPYLQEITWSLCAGEVFLSKYFEELFEKAVTYPQLRQIIITNGLLIDEKWAKKLVRKNVIISYSTDGATKKTYEYIRKGAKYEDLIRSINVVNKYKEKNKDASSCKDKMYTEINFVMMKSNYQEMEEMLEFAKEYNFDSLRFSPIEGITSYENIFFNKDMNAINHIKKIEPKLLEKAKEYKINLHIMVPKITGGSNTCCSMFNGGAKPVLCYLPWQSLSIMEDKSVKPQSPCTVSAGNVDKNSLKEIWNNKKMQMYRKNILDNCFDWCDNKCISGIMPQNMLKSTRFGFDGE